MANHEFYMRRCLDLALKAAGRTSPNPMVGAVLVRDGKIIAEGYHQKAGLPHAEVMAIRRASTACSPSWSKRGTGGVRNKDLTLYVNLEPCCHQGRTPPCTDAIIKAGIKQVVVGIRDPNRRVNGKGISELRKKGIKVRVGILEEECQRINDIYFKAITTGRPFVILKMAATLDGMVATGKGDSRWITSATSRKQVHH
ncbi:MAG: bifunctional diaminohydroxyphosphoribosylaminopyrimidine deaminase/5-amino-6-(5-phosphoribosylamino)uracil reductase RibD, partial [Deltaproteobacteria bacterium]|nr:bifunctional diaminohydroxyphosphoribosylaminopyrimidine deaminase/5-amino-6-(5-phosphoribosylamino)uracil reductase RibD [Deltaproteobacteria bacterium]